MNIEFATDMQRRVYKLLCEPGIRDVPIDVIFMRAHPGQAIERAEHNGDIVQLLSNREMQMKLGPLFMRMNAKLAAHGWRIAPGQLKQTYTLSRIEG